MMPLKLDLCPPRRCIAIASAKVASTALRRTIQELLVPLHEHPDLVRPMYIRCEPSFTNLCPPRPLFRKRWQMPGDPRRS